MKKLLLSLIVSLTALVAHSSINTDKLSFNVSPDSPMVFLADITLPGKDGKADTEILGPWFKMGFSVTNNSFDVYTLKQININFYDRETGDYYLMKVLDPSDLDSKRSVFAVLKKGESFLFSSEYFIDGLPVLKNKSTRYNIEAELIGWPGTPENPTNNYEYYSNFYTH